MKRLLYCLLGVLLLGGCEYKVHENFVELEKPSGEVEMGIVLNVENNGETIVLENRNAQVPYNLITSGHRPIGCVFSIGNHTLERPGGSGTLDFGLFSLPDGNYTLTCEMYLYTGSGSVAEDTGYEAYVGKFEWPLKIVDPNGSGNKLTHRINGDGYLELSWNKVPIGVSAFDYYRLSTPNEDIIIKDINQTSFVHRTYIGGVRWYQVYAYFNDDRNPWLCGDLLLTGEDLNLKMDYSREDSIVVNWTNPYRTVISIRGEVVDDWLVEKSPERSVCIPYHPFGTKKETMYFYVTAANPEDRDEMMNFSDALSVDRSPGTCITPDQGWARFGYNPLLKQLCVSTQSEVVGWSVPSLNPTGGRNSIPNPVTGYGVSHSSEKMVVCEYSTAHILNGRSLTTVITIPMEGGWMIVDEPVLTDDKLLSVVSYPKKLQVYNAVSGDLEYSVDLPIRNDVGGHTFIAPNGKYVYYVYDTGQIGVLTLDNYRVTGQSVIPATFDSWCINPIRPEQVFTCNRGRLTQYDGRNGSVVGSWNVPSDMRIANIDPDSGLLLLYSDYKAMILNPASGQEVYSRSIASWPCRLLGNTLISESGYALYLGKELQP